MRVSGKAGNRDERLRLLALRAAVLAVSSRLEYIESSRRPLWENQPRRTVAADFGQSPSPRLRFEAKCLALTDQFVRS